MEDIPRAGLSDRQFGFWKGRSTADALDYVLSEVYKNTTRNHFVMAIGLDVKNAFNSIPWPTIRHAFNRKAFPKYLRRIINSYLFERAVEFPIMVTLARRTNSCGVLQGSVLDPLL